MSYKLEKPYTDIQRADFVVLHNHQHGRNIKETQTALYALEPDEIMQDGLPVKNPDYAAEQLAKKKPLLKQAFTLMKSTLTVTTEHRQGLLLNLRLQNRIQKLSGLITIMSRLLLATSSLFSFVTLRQISLAQSNF